MINLGVIGFGYWGPNIVRNIMSIEGMKVLQIADLNAERLLSAKKNYPNISITEDLNDILNNKKINSVIIATPVSTHFKIAYDALKSGKNILVEKPLASSSDECLKLIELAERKNLILQVDHTFPYTEAVKKIKLLLDENTLGNILYFDSVRINLGLFHNDVSVIEDLAVHDISILDYLIIKKPKSVIANGVAHVKGQKENIAYITLIYDDKFIANIHVNWLSPVKVRKTLIGCDKKMVVYDDLEPIEKIKIYDKGIKSDLDYKQINEMRVGYRLGDMYSPQLKNVEALNSLLNHFKDCIVNQSTPITDGLSGLRVVKTIESATKSMNNNGRPEELF